MKKKEKKRTLTPQQEHFCQLYTTHWNAARAAKEAGYSDKNGERGYELRQKPLVQARIKELTEPALKEIGVSRERVLTELARIAFADIGFAFDDMGQLKPLSEMPEDIRRSIAGLEVHELFDGQGEQKTAIGLAKKIRFWDKPKAIETLAKHLGLLTEKVSVQGNLDHTTNGKELSPVVFIPKNGSEVTPEDESGDQK